MKKIFTATFVLMTLVGLSSPAFAETSIDMDAMSDDEMVEALMDDAEEAVDVTEVFPDVNDGDWFQPFVKRVIEEDLMVGYPDGRFGSWDPMNRAELAKVITKLLDRFEKPWYEEYLAELIILAITIIGWFSVISAVGRGHRRDVNVNIAYPDQQHRAANVEKPTEVPRAEAQGYKKMEHAEATSPVTEKNEKANWWNR